jgi:hypothetical protein
LDALTLIFLLPALQDGYTVRREHPRLLVEDPAVILRRVQGPLADDYAVVKARADRALRAGVEYINNKWAIPEDLMNLGLAFLVERARGGDATPYARAVVRQWGDGGILQRSDGTAFGYHALAYDWIHDAMTPDERVRFGDALGTWLRWYSRRPEITLQGGHWEYNQTWGPVHLNVMHSRDAITQKLFIALAILGAGTRFESDAKAFLDSWHRRIPAECLPAFTRMGGVWSESMGHGGYGPVTVIPYAFAAWRTATGVDLLKPLPPHAFPVEMPLWTLHTMMPHNDRTAWIDDGDGARPGAFVRAAPFLRDGISRHLADLGRDWIRERWQRVAALDPSIAPADVSKLPTAHHFKGAGHVYARSRWNDPDATWVFFGAGPQFAGHSRDDEGHFLINRKGALVSRGGGQGGNDDDYYSGGSMIYNLVTIFDPGEKPRRERGNENDGGLLRGVYLNGPWPRERGKIVAYEHAAGHTYAAADLTAGYAASKTKEVTRQFLYLRGPKEYVIVFDRVEASDPAFKRHWFLHVPTEPKRAGSAWTWTSLPEADGDREVRSRGRSRAFLHTMLPPQAPTEIRGGPGKSAWGHPLEPSAQYHHAAPGRERPPICPWRVEAADPGSGARTLFLHVLEIQEEGVAAPGAVKLLSPAGVELPDGRQVRFNVDGPPGGRLGTRALP